MKALFLQGFLISDAELPTFLPPRVCTDATPDRDILRVARKSCGAKDRTRFLVYSNAWDKLKAADLTADHERIRVRSVSSAPLSS
jgi:hypothetical protein